MNSLQRERAYNFTQRANYEEYVRITGQQPVLNETYIRQMAFWVGFSHASGNRFQTNPESKSAMKNRMAPDIERPWGPGWYKGEEFMHSKNYTGGSEDRFDIYDHFLYTKNISVW